MTINTEQYWDSRLNNNYNLLGVGDISLGIYYNQLLYKIRKIVFSKVLSALKTNKNEKILDIGSGTGFYIEQWKNSGFKNITGIDITEKAVRELSFKYPELSFKQLDIGSSFNSKELGSFDIVSAFDILFHIVDDESYVKAIENISRLLKQGGYFIFSDNFMPEKEFRIQHQVCRTFDFVKKTLEKNKLEIVYKIPMFILMNNPIKSQNRFLKKLWQINSKILRKRSFKSIILAKFLFGIEQILINIIKDGGSTEILITRKI